MPHPRPSDSLLKITAALLFALSGCGDDEVRGQSGPSSSPGGSGPSRPKTTTPGAKGSSSGVVGEGLAADPSKKGLLPDPAVALYPLRVRVTLDGLAPGRVILKQGGVDRHYSTDEQGQAVIGVNLGLYGDVMIHASHPEARIGYKKIDVKNPPPSIEIELRRFDRTDNENYKFRYPGVPEDELGCAHCHQRINRSWNSSMHRQAASNPTVHDLYAGVVGAIQDAKACKDAGGRWMEGTKPGAEGTAMRCYLGAGALPDLNDNCGDDRSCDQHATNFGKCADCHAPGMNGKAGGRNLLEARGHAFDFGVQCDVCHKVESLNPKGEPGVGGYLQLLRPNEPTEFIGHKYLPIYFGPFHDVSNAEMKSVQRDHFGKSEFCAGCHDYSIPVHPRWGPIDRSRWPTGRLPIQSTFREWQAGPFNPSAPCGSCHMPPYSDVWNAATLEPVASGVGSHANTPGRIAGWLRPPGSVRQHTWVGPRTPGSQLLQLAATVSVKLEPLVRGELSAKVTVKNVGPGHALPTGLPSRAMILLVRAQCGDQELQAIGGDVVPEFAGVLATKKPHEDWDHWPTARPGQRIRVLKHNGWINYQGPGRFSGQTFNAYQKGLPKYEFVLESTIKAVDRNGKVTLSQPLPKARADYAMLVEETRFGAGPPQNLAGAPGFAFARVMADKNGNLNVPTFRANDIRSDNRIMPQESWTSTHKFRATCSDPKVRALLLYRSFPPEWIRERRWKRDDVVMAEEIR